MKYTFYIANNRILTHVIFWAAIITINTFTYGTYDDEYLRQLHIELCRLLPALFAVYTNLYFLLPRFLINKKYKTYLFSVLLLSLLASIFFRILTMRFVVPIYYPEQLSQSLLSSWRSIIKSTCWNFSPIIFITLGIKLFKQWFQQQQVNQHLTEQKLMAELNFLRAQVHPHFMFNTLNNLYALTLQKSDKAPQTVLKLSDMMRYMLCESAEEKVPLQKEIQHIQNYIDLEKIRYSDRLDLSVNINGNVSSKLLAPLILLPFVENAFKHGASNELDQCWITIDLKTKEDELFFKVENSNHLPGKANDKTGYREGIGLKNVQRRLELLYPCKHQLSVINEDTSFSIDLKLSLT